MSNGVGLIAALSSSIPGPRRTDAPEGASRPKTRSTESTPSRPRTVETSTRTPVRVAETSGRQARTRGVVSVERREIAATTRTSASRPSTAPLTASIGRIKVVDPSRLSLSLNPAALGEVRIELSVRGSSLKAQVLTETEEARTLIQSRLDDLRDLLRGQGFRVREFRVDVAGKSGTTAEEERAGGPRSHRRQVLDVRA